jgi:L-fuculose-phosphate aldolase
MAVLLANHGAVALGRTMDEALTCARIVEKGCRAFVEAEFLGGAKSVGPVDALLMHQVYLRKYSRKAVGGADDGEAPR